MTLDIAQLQGVEVVDQDGTKIGSVGQVYVDDRTNEPTFATVRTGLFGTRESFVPLNEARSDAEGLRVPYTKDIVKGAPNIDSEGHLSEEEQDELYRYYELDNAQAGGPRDAGEWADDTSGADDRVRAGADDRTRVADNDTTGAAGAAGVGAAGVGAAGAGAAGAGAAAGRDRDDVAGDPAAQGPLAGRDRDDVAGDPAAQGPLGGRGRDDVAGDPAAQGPLAGRDRDDVAGDPAAQGPLGGRGRDDVAGDPAAQGPLGGGARDDVVGDPAARGPLADRDVQADSGRVRLRRYVVTEQETVTVPVQREKVEVVREPVDTDEQRVGGADADRTGVDRPDADLAGVDRPEDDVRLGDRTDEDVRRGDRNI